jgi:hypothetical protein
MRRLFAAVLLSLLLFPAAQSPAADPPRGATPAQVQESLQQLLLDLREARGLAAGITDKNLRARMEKVIATMETRCGDLQKQLAAVTTAPVRRPVTDADMGRFMKGLQSEAFDDGKLTVLRGFAGSNHFTCKQAGTLVKAFAFGDGQGKAAVFLHPRLVDPGNFFEVLQVMTFESDRARVRKQLGLK